MGQCNSSHAAVDCCSDPARHPPAVADPRAADVSTNSTKPAPVSLLGQQAIVESTCSSTGPNAIQFSVSLDQQSEHSVCTIRVEFLDGKSVLLTTSLHGSSSHHTSTTNKTVAERNQAGWATANQADKKHCKDIHFTTSPAKQNPTSLPAVYCTHDHRSDTPRPESPQMPELNPRPDLWPQKVESRRSAFRHQADVAQIVHFATSDGALQRRPRHTGMADKENSWCRLGYGMESEDSLDLKSAFFQNKNNSCHSQETANSWGGISIQRSMKMLPSTKKPGGKAPFPPIDISMNDVSGNTLPTRVDYEDGHDDVSEAEDDEEFDHQWEYHRNARSLSAENAMSFGPSSCHSESETSSVSSSIDQAPPKSFISNISHLPEANSYLCRHRHSSLFFHDTGVNNHSSRSCQSDSCIVKDHKLQTRHRHTSREPWNPQSFPPF